LQYVRARLGRPHSFNYDFKGAFSVHDLVDLNLIGQAAVSPTYLSGFLPGFTGFDP